MDGRDDVRESVTSWDALERGNPLGLRVDSSLRGGARRRGGQEAARIPLSSAAARFQFRYSAPAPAPGLVLVLCVLCIHQTKRAAPLFLL